MSEQSLDLKEFLDRVQDDKELLLELLDIFSKDFKEKRKHLDSAVKSKDYEQLRSIAHSVKGASGNISAKAVRAICMTLEDMGKNQHLNGIEQLLVDLDKQFEILQGRITEIKDEFKA